MNFLHLPTSSPLSLSPSLSLLPLSSPQPTQVFVNFAKHQHSDQEALKSYEQPVDLSDEIALRSVEQV